MNGYIHSHLNGPTSGRSHILLVQKSRRMKSYIQAIQYQIATHSRRSIFFTCTITHLSAIPVFDIFKSFPVFSCDWICWICQFWSKSANVYILLHFSSVLGVFLLTFSLTEFLRAFFQCSFLLGLRKKDTGKKAGKKCFPKVSQKYLSIN